MPDLEVLLDSWILTLRAERKSPATIKSYSEGVRGFLRWCEEEGTASTMDKRTVNAYIAAVLESGKQAATARARQLALRRFSAWLEEEGELPADPLLGLKAPKLDSKVIEPLTEDEIKRLLKVCQGKDFRDRRDESLVRLMVETGMRAGEAASLLTEDVNLLEGVSIVRRGKGGKGRPVPFGPQTARALDRYKRMRTGHRLADQPEFWLGDRGKRFSYDALHKALRERAALAGIDRFHPHLLRHTAAHRWLSAGGSELGLMAVAGWTRPDMVQRYTRARASDRAAAEARSLNLGDL